MNGLFWLYLPLLELWILGELAMAYRDGWAFEWQVRHHNPVPKKFFTFWAHLGMWGDFFIIAPVTAYLLDAHAASWSVQGFFVIAFVSAAIGTAMLMPVLPDSLTTPSSLARDGSVPIPGVMHYLFLTFALAVIGAFYVLTGKQDVSKGEVCLITVAVAVHWAIGVLHPPYKLHGHIHALAWVSTITVTIAVVILGLRLMF